MTSSPYLDAVGGYLRADGWEIQSTQLQPGTFRIFGQQSSEGDRTIVALVVTAEGGPVTPEHLQHLLEASRDQGADLPILASESPLETELVAAAADNDVHVLDDDELDLQGASESAADAEPTATTSTADTEPADTSASDQEPTASTTPDSFPDPRKQLEAYLASKLSRRRVLAGSLLLGGGTAAGGYGWYRFAPSRLERFKADAEELAYDDLRANVDQHLGTAVYFPSARLAQVIDTEGDDDRLRLQVTQGDDGTWQDDILGRWDGDPYTPGEIVECWGVVNGSVRYETSLGIERTVPDIDIVDIVAVGE